MITLGAKSGKDFAPNLSYSAPMGTITNLSRFRKAKARADKRARADENARRHGRSKAEREAEALAARKAERDLDGHKREEP